MYRLQRAIQTMLERAGYSAYCDTAPDNAVMPYISYQLHGPGVDAEYTDGSRNESLPVWFHVYDTDYTFVSKIMKHLEAMQWRDMLMIGWRVIDVWFSSRDLSRDPDLTYSGRIVWHGLISLEFSVTHNQFGE